MLKHESKRRHVLVLLEFTTHRVRKDNDAFALQRQEIP